MKIQLRHMERTAVVAALLLACVQPACKPTGPNPGDAGGTDMFVPPGPQCDNGYDDDGDGRVDFPLEPGCTDALDDDETDPIPPPACANGLDDDGDGAIDYGFGGLGGDPGCTFAADDDEENVPECMDTIDNDGDMLVDFPDDPGCTDANDVTEFQVECKDGVDNDGDMLTDFPDDPDCDDPLDPDEQAPPVCNDGLDNDGDGLIDFPMDPGCDDNFDTNEFNPADCQGLAVEDASDGDANGDTTGLTGSLFAPSCGGSAAPEGLAYINVPADLDHIEFNTFGSDHETVITLLPTCDPMATEVACSTDPTNAFLEIDDLPAGDYWIVVDGQAASDVGFWRVGYFGVIAPAQPCVPGDTSFLCDLAAGFMCMEVSPGAGTICTAGTCSDGLDNDMDGIADWPWDPGCDDPADSDETDPGTPPQCSDGMDNDADMLIDYPADPGCMATSDNNEIDECIPGVQVDTFDATGTATGTLLAGTSNFNGSCNAGAFVPGPEDVYAFDQPYPVANLIITTDNPGTVANTDLYVRTTCDDGSTELACIQYNFSGVGTTLNLPNVTTGSYFLFVDLYDSGVSGPYTVTLQGILPGNSICDPADQIYVCDGSQGFVCADPGIGMTICTAGECSDMLDNDGDMLIDFPDEPGCTSLSDNDETDPMTPAVCSDGMDNDGDAIIDYPLDPGCFYAADPTEEDECIPGVPLLDVDPSGTTAGMITGFTGLFEGTCSAGFSTSGDEDVYIITVPYDATVTFDTFAAGSFFDTAIYVRTVCDSAPSEVACNNDPPGTSGVGATLTTFLTAGTYFVFVDTPNQGSGSYDLQHSGVIAPSAPCDPANMLFICDAVAGFTCADPSGMGNFICTAGECSDGLDNDGDMITDYPLDPGCVSLSDNDETTPMTLPQCFNGIDDDGDMLIDYPADTGCAFAGDDDEEGCAFDFDDGTLQGFTVSNTCGTGVGWTEDNFRSVSPMYSLYYGNPATRNFDCSGLTNSGIATSPPITLSAGSPALTFEGFWSTEGGTFYDQMDVYVIDALGGATAVWLCVNDLDCTSGASTSFASKMVDLTPWAGTTINLEFRFDTMDGAVNQDEGAYVDDIFVNGACP